MGRCWEVLESISSISKHCKISLLNNLYSNTCNLIHNFLKKSNSHREREEECFPCEVDEHRFQGFRWKTYFHEGFGSS